MPGAGTDPTELAVLEAARMLLGADTSSTPTSRLHAYPVPVGDQLVVDASNRLDGSILHVKGAPESVMSRLGQMAVRRRTRRSDADRDDVAAAVDGAWPGVDLRVLGVGGAPPARQRVARGTRQRRNAT